MRLLALALNDSEIATECSIGTRAGVKVADVVWMSPDFLSLHGEVTPYPQAPELCVEILSPSNSVAEIEDKIRLYLGYGAREVWVIADDGSISIYGSESMARKVCAQILFFRGSKSLLGFEIFPNFATHISRWGIARPARRTGLHGSMGATIFGHDGLQVSKQVASKGDLQGVSDGDVRACWLVGKAINSKVDPVSFQTTQ